MTPEILVARRHKESLEREIVFGAVRSHKFFLNIKDLICPSTSGEVFRRKDFSIDRFNSLWDFIAMYYQRYDNTSQNDEIGIPNEVLANYVIDSANSNFLPPSEAEKLVAEIKEETGLTNSLTYESSMALVRSPAFADWWSSQVTIRTAVSIGNQRGLGTLSMETLEETVLAARQAVSMFGTNGNDIARPIGEFVIPAEDDSSCLIGPHRFLSREGLLTLVGPSGIGKSTLAMQMAMAFALGREVFGFIPAMPLKILIIQGENDEGDIAEMRDGTIAGLELSDDEKATVSANVLCCRCNSVTGKKFIQGVVRKNLQRFKPDLLIIDPALCYIGGDTKEQKIVGEFLRTFLLPELQLAKCGCMLLHHTNKPPTQNPKGGTANEDAYAEGGSAEFRNVARAVISLRRIGDGNVFELRVPKRGNRLGWVDAGGQATTKKYIRHSTQNNRLFWEVATEEEANNARAAVEENKFEAIAAKVLACISRHGEISQADLLAEAKKLEIGYRPCRDAVKILLEDGRVLCIDKPRSGARPGKYYSPANKVSIPGGGK